MEYQIYSGAGNDFVIFDNRDGAVPFEKQKEFTQKVCSEQFKELDGVIFLEKPRTKDASIRMNYYNRDGSYGAMCGNGARCISQFVLDNGILKEKVFNLEAVDKIYKAEILGSSLVRISFPPLSDYRLNLRVKVNSGTDSQPGYSVLNAHWMQAGSEHFVLFINDEENRRALGVNSLDDVKVNEWGRRLRYHKGFDPPGANVNFADLKDGNEIRVRTYERGVERETLACGTGIISTAVISSLVYSINPPVKVLSRSGEYLTVNFNSPGTGRGQIENLSLEGSARKISEGKV